MKKYSVFRYYLLFLYYKLRILIDCSEGRWRVMVSEVIHLGGVLLGRWIEMPGEICIKTITTIWGRYKFVGDLHGQLVMNPSFERPDIEYFISLMKEAIGKKENILFLDIGANVGLYSVGVSNRIRSNHMVTHAFEPDPIYCRLLLDNIKTNNIKNVTVHPIGLGDQRRTINTTGFATNDNTVSKTIVPLTIRTLDSVLSKKDIKRFDRIFIKIDIEGQEEKALRGSVQFLQCRKPMLFLIEDCMNPTIVSYLYSHDFRLRCKITPYNSFWELH